MKARNGGGQKRNERHRAGSRPLIDGENAPLANVAAMPRTTLV